MNLECNSFYIGDVTKRLKDVKIEISNPIRVNSELLDYVKFDLIMSRGKSKSKNINDNKL